MEYITIRAAAKELGVTRGTLYYYMRTLQIDPKKFQLDRQSYIGREDVQRIQKLKEDAQERRQQRGEQ